MSDRPQQFVGLVIPYLRCEFSLVVSKNFWKIVAIFDGGRECLLTERN